MHRFGVYNCFGLITQIFECMFINVMESIKIMIDHLWSAVQQDVYFLPVVSHSYGFHTDMLSHPCGAQLIMKDGLYLVTDWTMCVL